MRLIGVNFSKISVEKKNLDKISKINTNIDIKSVERKKIDLVKDSDVFNFEYEFKITYENNVGELVFKGSVLMLIGDAEFEKEIEEKWKDKKLPEKLRIPLLNIVFSRCNLKAMQLEEDIGLPPHIPTPKISVPESEENKEEVKED